MKLTHCVLTAMALALSGSLAAQDSGSGSRIATQFGGKPPFKRSIVSADSAAERATPARALPTVGERVHVAQFRARPPFERRIVEFDAESVAEFARFEEVKAPSDSSRRFGAPGKGHR